jgi:hypothetical protein
MVGGIYFRKLDPIQRAVRNGTISGNEWLRRIFIHRLLFAWGDKKYSVSLRVIFF